MYTIVCVKNVTLFEWELSGVKTLGLKKGVTFLHIRLYILSCTCSCFSIFIEFIMNSEFIPSKVHPSLKPFLAACVSNDYDFDFWGCRDSIVPNDFEDNPNGVRMGFVVALSNRKGMHVFVRTSSESHEVVGKVFDAVGDDATYYRLKWVSTDDDTVFASVEDFVARVTPTPSLFEEVVKSDMNLDVIESLLQKGVDPNAYDERGSTCLHLVLMGKRGDEKRYLCVQLLITYGADVNLATRDGQAWTPLMFAAKNCLHVSLTLLLRSGADVCAANSEGKMAEDVAYAVDNVCGCHILWVEKEFRRAQEVGQQRKRKCLSS